MIRFLFRFVGFWVLAAAFVAFVYDGARSIGAGALVTSPAGETWYAISPASQNITQAAIQRHVAPWLWDDVMIPILLTPTWVVLGVLGILLLLIGRRPEKRIGFERM